MATTRKIIEGTIFQGEDEKIAYTLDVTNIGDSPTSPTVVVKDLSGGGTDVTSTVMPTGSASVSGNVITLPALTALTDGKNYRVEVKYTIDGNIFETPFLVIAEE